VTDESQASKVSMKNRVGGLGRSTGSFRRGKSSGRSPKGFKGAQEGLGRVVNGFRKGSGWLLKGSE